MTEEQELVWKKLSEVSKEPYLEELDKFISKRYIMKKYLDMSDDEIEAYLKSVTEYVS